MVKEETQERCGNKQSLLYSPVPERQNHCMLKVGHLGGNAKGMNSTKQGRSGVNLWVSAFIGGQLGYTRKDAWGFHWCI